MCFQFHGAMDLSFVLLTRLLCFLIIWLTFSIQLRLTLTVFLLNVLCSLLDFGKSFSNERRNIFVTFVIKIFFRLLDKHFPKSNTLHKIFNRNTVKVRYSCMENVSQIIKKHNNKNNCPMNGDCRFENVVYKCVESTTEKSKEHVCISVVRAIRSSATAITPCHLEIRNTKRKQPFNFFMRA